MKIFMVFVALTIVFLSAFSFVADLNNFSLLEKNLKVIAEECACGAALMTDNAMISYGYLEIDKTAARTCCENMCRRLSSAVPVFAKGSIRVDSVDVGENFVSVKLKYVQTQDLFRLPWLTKYSFSREAEYRWE